jgi:hypothetical protein
MKAFAWIFSLLLISGCATGRTLPDAEKDFSQVFEVPGLGRNEIFSGIRVWIGKNFTQGMGFKYENREEGSIIFDGSIPFPCKGISCSMQADWSVFYNCQIDVKDGKFRMAFSQMTPHNTAWPITEKNIGQIKADLIAIGNEISASIQKPESDW